MAQNKQSLDALIEASKQIANSKWQTDSKGCGRELQTTVLDTAKFLTPSTVVVIRRTRGVSRLSVP